MHEAASRLRRRQRGSCRRRRSCRCRQRRRRRFPAEAQRSHAGPKDRNLEARRGHTHSLHTSSRATHVNVHPFCTRSYHIVIFSVAVCDADVGRRRAQDEVRVRASARPVRGRRPRAFRTPRQRRASRSRFGQRVVRSCVKTKKSGRTRLPSSWLLGMVVGVNERALSKSSGVQVRSPATACAAVSDGPRWQRTPKGSHGTAFAEGLRSFRARHRSH